MITEPGVYTVTPAEYHADPVEGGSLSSSGARALLPPSCPARFRWDADHGGRPPRDHFDLGHAAHKLVLGVGNPIDVIDAPDWRTKDAKEAKAAAHAAGRIPLLADTYQIVEDMAAALRAHPVAPHLLEDGTPEQTLVWDDPRTGVRCRAMLDFLPEPAPIGRRMIIPDYKTCASAEPEALRRSMANFGYHQQAVWYLEGASAVAGAGRIGVDASFVFICQEKTAPYLVTIFEPDTTALRIGAERNHVARSVYAHCKATDTWPAYVDGIAYLGLPAWAEIQQGADQ